MIPLHIFLGLVATTLLPLGDAAQCPCNTTSNYALLMDFYTTTTGWINSFGWENSSVPICDWCGITCDGTAIIQIDVQGNHIAGPLPSSWSNFVRLQNS